MVLKHRCENIRWAIKISLLSHSRPHFVGVGMVTVYFNFTCKDIF